MTSPTTEPRTGQLYHTPRVALDPALASVVVAVAMASFLLVGALAPRAINLLAAQLVLIVIPIVAALAWGRVYPELSRLRLLGIAPADRRYLGAAILLGASLWLGNLWILRVLATAVDLTTPPALRQAIQQASLPMSIATLVVLPPLAEELVFRGVFARGLATRLPTIAAIAISAALFSIYHRSLLQALPTLIIGIPLAWLAIRADSILPGVIVHALNNLIGVLLARNELPEIGHWLQLHLLAVTIACSLATVAGIALIVTTPRRVT